MSKKVCDEAVRDISEKVYRLKLEQSCKGDVERMIKKDGDSGEGLRRRAECYDATTRVYLKVLNGT